MKNAFSALMMTFVMLLSLSAVAVSAAIPDGDGTNGIDRNPTSPEQDVSVVTRTIDMASATSSMEVTFDSGMIRNSNPAASTANLADLYSPHKMKWDVTTAIPNTGPGASAQYALPSDPSELSHGADHGLMVDISDTAEVTLIDIESSSQVKTTFQNWYGSLDRTTPHGVGDSISTAILGECNDVGSRLVCNMNADFDGDASNGNDGIDDGLTTNMMVAPSSGGGDAAYGYGLLAEGSTADKYFGIDFQVAHNATLIVDGVALAEGNTQNVQENAEVIIRCTDLKCTEDDIVLSVPTAYDASNWDNVNLILPDDAEIYNSTSRISVYDQTTFKLTFGVDASHTSNATASGVLWDPSVIIETNEPGMRMGKIHDGEMSWCDASWFLAKCNGAESFDGNTTDGADGMIMRITLPLETFWSMAAWGGYDNTMLQITHPNTDSCFNGQVNTHIYTEAGYDALVSKNSMINYLLSGNYYSVGDFGVADSSASFGTSAVDYCTGSTSGIVATDIKLDALASITQNPLLVSYNNGMYDIAERVFDFYVVVSPEVGTMNAGSPSFNVNMEGGDAPKLKFTHSTNQDPLANQPGITRTTDTTNQTNPAFATPYVMHYSGITPSDNVIQGRDLVGFEQAGGDYGPEFMGIQDASTWDARTDEASYAPTESTPRSTVECGVAVADADMVESSIEIFTNVDTSKHTGENNESEWKAYGVRNSNNSLWGMGPFIGANTGNLSVDNKEVNTGSSAVSYTGVFVNGDNYKAVCTFKFTSYDVQAENFTTQTLTYTTQFSAAEDGDYNSGGGGDVGDDDGLFDDLDGYDYLIIGLALAIAILGGVMLFRGDRMNNGFDWFDDRFAMVLFGVGIIHAWIAHHFFYDVADPLSEEWALVIGSAGYIVIGLSIYLYGGGNTTRSMRNMRYLVGGLLLILLGVPTALEGFTGGDFEDVSWTFPVYDVIAFVGSAIGTILLASGLGILFRREGMN